MGKLYDLTFRDHLIDRNYTPGRREPIRRIVIHHNAGHGHDPRATWTTGGREASAHYQVWGDGRKVPVDQIVRDGDEAWHAHEANADSIGIEHENLGMRDSNGKATWPISDDGLHASAELVGYLCAKHDLGLPKFGDNITTHNAVESDGIGVDSGTACPGPYFIKILKDPDHWYWAEARAAYRRATGTAPTPISKEFTMNAADEAKIATIVRKVVREEANKGVNVRYLMTSTGKWHSIELFMAGSKAGYLSVATRVANVAAAAKKKVGK